MMFNFRSAQGEVATSSTARSGRMVQRGAMWCNVVQCGAVWCNVVQCGAVWCSVVQCGAVWCKVQCGAESYCGTVYCKLDRWLQGGVSRIGHRDKKSFAEVILQ
jgi:hypothetical protein